MMTPEKAEQGEQAALIFLLTMGVPATNVGPERVVPGGLLYSYWLDGSLAHGKHLVFVNEEGQASYSQGVIVNLI